MKHLPRHDYVSRPWRNGGGVTHEVAVWPEGAGMDDFAWRVSMAELREAGPFSSYPGVTRSLLLVEGGAVRLDIDGNIVWMDRRDAAPLQFSGAARVFAQPHGRALDAGVMSRDALCRHRCQVLHLSGTSPLLRRSASGLLLLLEGGPLRVVAEADASSLGPRDAVRFAFEDPLELHLSSQGPARLLFAEFDVAR